MNLIGDHTDHSGGLVLPMAIHLATTISGERGGDSVELRSSTEPQPAYVPLDVGDPAALQPEWARYVAAVTAELRPATGLRGSVDSTLPVGAGLSSSAAFEVALALALGFEGPALDLALLAQRAEHRASGVPCGIMDQLACAAGVEGHALRIDCTSFEVQAVPMPADVDVVVVDSRQRRRLSDSAYAQRVAECRAAEAEIGPLRHAAPAGVEAISDSTIRRRARHVVSENLRVDQFASALTSGDRASMADALAASHHSLRDDFDVSTPLLDELVELLAAIEGVIGARLTGAGFGGCVVVLAERGAPLPADLAHWRVRASAGARLLVED